MRRVVRGVVHGLMAIITAQGFRVNTGLAL